MIEKLDFSHEEDVSEETFLRRIESSSTKYDKDFLLKSYHFAQKAHEGQKRRSGEDYFVHPVNVAYTLIKLKMDTDSVASGLLHDVVEDCNVAEETLEQEFSSPVRIIVEGLTKISKIKFKTVEENQAENFRKMVVAMAKDIRVIIVKLSDRLHNMRTLQYVSEIKQKKIAKETLDIFVPLAGRLGINSLKAELEDLCLRYLHPDFYYRLAEKVAKKKSERDGYIREVIGIIKDKLQEYSVQAEVTGRSKHFYSIYKKIQQRGVDFENIQDMLAFRIIVSNISECYKCLGVIHSYFTPIPGRFKDYIAIPKVNNYQSLHTTVIGPRAEKIEIQIRTYEMHEIAETGVAAHWMYKEKRSGIKAKLDWVQELLEFNSSVENNNEFMDVVKNDLDIGGVFVFTPDGDVKELRYGSTPLDFAYAIHTEVGNRCVGAKVNGKMVPLRYRLKSGDVVEIVTSKTQTPSKDWLKLVKTSRAKTKIKQWLLKVERDRYAEMGNEILEKLLRKVGMNIKTFRKKGHLQLVMDKFSYKSEEELCIHIGSGKVTASDIYGPIPEADNLIKENNKDQEAPKEIGTVKDISRTLSRAVKKDNAVIVDGIDDVLARPAKCCNPIPGDPIVGFVTRGRGITVHTYSCKKKNENDLDRMISVSWNEGFAFKHPVNVRAITKDRPGILALISKRINGVGVNIKGVTARSLPDQKGSIVFEVEVKDYSELLKVISSIESMEDVISVSRV